MSSDPVLRDLARYEAAVDADEAEAERLWGDPAGIAAAIHDARCPWWLYGPVVDHLMGPDPDLDARYPTTARLTAAIKAGGLETLPRAYRADLAEYLGAREARHAEGLAEMEAERDMDERRGGGR